MFKHILGTDKIKITLAPLSFAKIDSTQTGLKVIYRVCHTRRLLSITADEQSAGRGRFKTHLAFSAGVNLYVTFCWFVEADRRAVAQSSQLVALTLIEVLEKWNFCRSP